MAATTRVFTASEVWNNPDLVILDSLVIDISTFARKHPGGAGPLLAAGGTDVSSLFHSMHRRTAADLERYKGVLHPFVVGRINEGQSSYEYNSEFAQDLYQEVCAVLPPHKWWANNAFITRTVAILGITILAELAWILTGRWDACVAVGLLHAQIGLAVQHDASHGAVSRNAIVNAALAYGADWIGNTRWLWFEQHIIGHHPNTNHAVKDPDSTSAEPFLLFRTVEAPVRKAFHRLQHLFMYPVLFMYGPSVVFNLSQLWTLNHADEVPVAKNKFLAAQWFPSFVFRIFYWVRTIILPFYIGNAPLWLCLLGVNFITGACLTFVFVLSHNFVGSCRFPERDHKDWYKMQVETSCTYGGFLSGLLTGGLCFQIEHHCFPRMCSIHYPLISPVVRRVCRKHNVNYTYFPNIVENMMSTIEFMRLNGMSELHMD